MERAGYWRSGVQRVLEEQDGEDRREAVGNRSEETRWLAEPEDMSSLAAVHRYSCWTQQSIAQGADYQIGAACEIRMRG